MPNLMLYEQPYITSLCFEIFLQPPDQFSGALSFNNPKAFILQQIFINPSHPNSSGKGKKISNKIHYDKFIPILKFFNLKPPFFLWNAHQTPSNCTCSYLILFLPKKLLNLLYKLLITLLGRIQNLRPIHLNSEQNRLNKSKSPKNREMLGSP